MKLTRNYRQKDRFTDGPFWGLAQMDLKFKEQHEKLRGPSRGQEVNYVLKLPITPIKSSMPLACQEKNNKIVRRRKNKE